MVQDKTGRREQLYGLLGDLPPLQQKISAAVESITQKDEYILEKLILNLNGTEPVPAYFVKPLHCADKTPCILYNHSHGGNYLLGKEELLAGNEYLQTPPYAQVLTSLGYSVLCIDAWCFGERHGLSELELFKEMLWKGQVLWGMMVYDSLRALDYICSRTDVDPKRIGTLGMSMGSTMAWWAAALDSRIGVCVDICCLTDFSALIEENGLNRHGIYYYVPSLLKFFTAADINALISPRPHLSVTGKRDLLTPQKGVERITRELREVYRNEEAADKWVQKQYDTGHCELAEMRTEVVSFLRKWL
ncbi:MAG: acetylxylan esterase [Spirochaetia bacterium]|nr:acetylxylan esterase [Spirochaetia bacterium]